VAAMQNVETSVGEYQRAWQCGYTCGQLADRAYFAFENGCGIHSVRVCKQYGHAMCQLGEQRRGDPCGHSPNRRKSMISHRQCRLSKCTSWMRAVLCASTQISTSSARSARAISPPSRPVSAITRISRSWAA